MYIAVNHNAPNTNGRPMINTIFITNNVVDNMKCSNMHITTIHDSQCFSFLDKSKSKKPKDDWFMWNPDIEFLVFYCLKCCTETILWDYFVIVNLGKMQDMTSIRYYILKQNVWVNGTVWKMALVEYLTLISLKMGKAFKSGDYFAFPVNLPHTAYSYTLSCYLVLGMHNAIHHKHPDTFC